MTVRVLGIPLTAGALLLPAPARPHHHRLQPGGFEGLIVALAPDPARPATPYAGVFGQGVFKTTDGGETWTESSAGLADLSVLALLVDPANTDRLFAGTDGGVAVAFALPAAAGQAQVNPCAAKTLNPCTAKTLNPCLAKTLSPEKAKTLSADDAKKPKL